MASQHADLKRIAEFRRVKITDLGVEMAEKFIDDFYAKNKEAMDEMAALEQRMDELRKRTMT